MGRFVLAVEQLLEAEAFCESLSSPPAGQEPSPAEVRKFRRGMKKFGQEVCHDLKKKALQEVQELGFDAMEALPVNLGWSLAADVVAQLCEPGVLGDGLVLCCDKGFLREGWRLLGGMALGSVAPDMRPVPMVVEARVQPLLQSLAESMKRAWFAFRIPGRDVLVHCILELDAWSSRLALAQEEELKVARWSAQARLQESIEGERERFAARSLSVGSRARPLQPAHLEKRVHWSEYRDVARINKIYRRRAVVT